MSEEKVIVFLGKIAEWYEKYERCEQAEQARAIRRDAEKFRIRVPFIGKFSAGKSTLLNTLLDVGELLETDIDPTTAIPAEICYSADNCDRVFLYTQDGAVKEISPEEYGDRAFDSASLKKIRISLRAEALRDLPDIDLVDMPGVSSSIKDHDRVLNSEEIIGSAYVLVFPYNEPTPGQDILSVLKELTAREGEVPFAVAITRTDRQSEAEKEKVADYLRESLRKYIDQDFPVFLTSRDDPDSAREICDTFLRELQDGFGQQLERRYQGRTAALADDLRLYLEGQLRSLSMSTSEFEGQQERLEQELEKLKQDMARQQEDFRQSIPTCLEQIQGYVSQTLYDHEYGYMRQIMKGHSPDAEINADVRQALIRGVKEYFEPRVQTYLEQTQSSIRSAVVIASGGEGADIPAMGVGLGAGIIAGGAAAAAGGGGAVAAVLGSTAFGSGLAAALGTSVATLSIPVVGAAIFGVVSIIATILNLARKKEKEQECLEKLRTEVFPKILEELKGKLTAELDRAAQTACDAMELEGKQKAEQLQRALDEAAKNRQQEEDQRSALKQALERDLTEWKELCHEYGY